MLPSSGNEVLDCKQRQGWPSPGAPRITPGPALTHALPDATPYNVTQSTVTAPEGTDVSAMLKSPKL